MVKSLVTTLIIAVMGVGLAFTCGCESDAQTGALIGTAAGAGVGQAIGHNTQSTLIGAGVGAAGGYMIGNESDKKKTKAEMQSLQQQNMQLQQQNAQVQQEMSTVTINVTNSNGSISPVTLRKQGVVYIGPRGETYTTLPTQEQLKQAGYGF
ncbi:MAG: glycine zipper domain-containing protein [Phycisphaerae bacterium]|nr:glycine zipper domain-containing protein [Phycisphaerae bacterium]MDD5381110.1 glycine zipper domain-containing protein [Phycisphaerae bacterium]